MQDHSSSTLRRLIFLTQLSGLAIPFECRKIADNVPISFASPSECTMRLAPVYLCLSVWLTNPGLVCSQSVENITGVLHKIDVKTGTIAIRPGKLGDKAEKTFNLLRPDIEVVTELGRARLNELSPGNVVHLHLNEEEDVDAIRAELPVVRAALTALDLPKQTIRVLAEDFGSKSFVVTGATKIAHRGMGAALADLTVYQWLEITTSLDGKNTLAIAAHSPGTRNGRVPSGKLYGNIILLDVMTGTLLFHNTKGRERLLSFAVPKDLSTWVVLDRRPVDVLQGPHNMASKPATLYLSADRQEVKRILADAPRLRCQVKAVDLERRRLTVNENGATRTWELPADFKVMHGQRKGKAEDLRADTAVDLVLSLDRSKLRAVVLAIPQ